MGKYLIPEICTTGNRRISKYDLVNNGKYVFFNHWMSWCSLGWRQQFEIVNNLNSEIAIQSLPNVLGRDEGDYHPSSIQDKLISLAAAESKVKLNHWFQSINLLNAQIDIVEFEIIICI